MQRAVPAFILALFLSLLAPARAQPAEGDMPCVEEVCVGDDALSLGPIPWETVHLPDSDVPLAKARVAESSLQRVRKLLRGSPDAIREFAPYWLSHALDAQGLKALAGIDAVCESVGIGGRLRASYLSGPGFRTVVSFEPMASEDGRVQRFVVASIRRYVVGEVDDEALKAMRERMVERYRGFPVYARATQAAAGWVEAGARGPHLRLLAPVGDAAERDSSLRSHPACAQPAVGETAEAPAAPPAAASSSTAASQVAGTPGSPG